MARYRHYVCFAPDMCAPCRSNQHEQCSFDGEPDCLCTACPKSRKVRNRAELDATVGTGLDA